MKRIRDQLFEVVANFTKKRPKLKTNSKDSEVSLSGMPTEVLEEIFKKLPICDFGRVRGTCIQFRNAIDNILIQNLSNKARTIDGNWWNVECVLSKIFYLLSWPYLRYGLRSTAAGVYLSVLNSRTIYSDGQEEFLEVISIATENFYYCIESQLRGAHTQVSRLLYCVAILGFLNKLGTHTDVLAQDELVLFYSFKDVYFNLPRSHSKLIYPDDANSVILYLAEAIRRKIKNSKMHNICDNINANGTSSTDSVHIEVTIRGSEKLLKFFSKVPEVEDWDELPTDNFTVSIEIVCREAGRLECPEKCLFKI